MSFHSLEQNLKKKAQHLPPGEKQNLFIEYNRQLWMSKTKQKNKKRSKFPVRNRKCIDKQIHVKAKALAYSSSVMNERMLSTLQFPCDDDDNVVRTYLRAHNRR